jgi:site-specific recombinase XerD
VFGEYLPLAAEGQLSVDQIMAAADRWVSRHPRPHNVTDYRYGKLRFISDAKQWLGFLGRLRVPELPRPPYAQLLDEFTDYLIQERGLSRYTVRVHRWYLAQFLERCGHSPRSLSTISIADIDAALTRKGEQEGYARASLHSYATALRSFFRYAETRGWCRPGLAAAIMAPRSFAEEGLPKGPTWADVQRLLASTEGETPKNIRDRAILLLFAVYGLRVGEVRALRVEDLDWETEVMAIRRPKLRRMQLYPLSYPVGEAIQRYLHEVRPRVPDREVFLTVRAPWGPLSAGALYDVVGERLPKLGVALRHHGPHALRHACAMHLLAQGVSLKVIGDHLGHRKAETTRVYAKVNLAGLRQVADFDLGGVL